MDELKERIQVNGKKVESKIAVKKLKGNENSSGEKKGSSAQSIGFISPPPPLSTRITMIICFG